MKTDNSYFDLKVNLRLNSLLLFKKQNIIILDAFAGDGLLWSEIQRKTSKNIEILRIEKKKNSLGIYLIGDNIKFIRGMDLARFDIIDLDAYGSPYRQLNEIFKQNYKGIIHCTFIQTIMGVLNKKMLIEIGYNKEMIDKIPTLFNQNGLKKICQYLASKGVINITGYFINNKNYFYFAN